MTQEFCHNHQFFVNISYVLVFSSCSHAYSHDWHLQSRILLIISLSYIDATDGHKADSPSLISPVGDMDGVQTFPAQKQYPYHAADGIHSLFRKQPYIYTFRGDRIPPGIVEIFQSPPLRIQTLIPVSRNTFDDRIQLP